MRRRLTAGLAVLMAGLLTTPVFAGGWVQDPGRAENQNGISNWWYRYDDGSYPANGWYWLDGNQDGVAESYRFDGNGWMYISTGVDGYVVDGSGAWTVNGEVQRRQVGMPSQAADGQGSANGTGNSASSETQSSVKNQWVKDANGKRYYNSKGELVTGWKKIDGKKYYFDDSGYMLTGYQEVDGSGYYFYSDGELATKTVHVSEDGVYYVIDQSEYTVVDVVDESEWTEYKKEADSSSVNVTNITTENKEKETTSTSAKTADDGLNEELAMECFDLINAEREKEGLDPLEFDETIYEACEVRAAELVELFSHTRPDGSDCFTALDEAGYSYGWWGENIAAGQQTAAEAVDSWMHSSRHRKNILTKQYKHGAIGCYVSKDSEYGVYWVQMFTD